MGEEELNSSAMVMMVYFMNCCWWLCCTLQVITNLSRAKEELERSAAAQRKLTHKLDKARTEGDALRAKMAEQAGVIEQLLAEINVSKAPTKKKWSFGGSK
jgi:cell division protein FtsX